MSFIFAEVFKQVQGRGEITIAQETMDIAVHEAANGSSSDRSRRKHQEELAKRHSRSDKSMHSKHKCKNILVAVVVCIFLSGGTSRPGPKSSAAAGRTRASSPQKLGDVSARLRAIIASGRLEDLRWPNFTDYRKQLESFYRPSGYTLAWLQKGEPTAQAAEMIQVLQDADSEGLRAEDYDGSRWTDRLTRLRAPHSASDEAGFDAALSVCAMRYISDVRIGRINPLHFGFGLDVSHKKLDLDQYLRQRVIDGTDLRAELVEIEPPFAGYKRLRSALLHYEELEKIDDGEALPDPVPALFPGGQYKGIPRLTKLLKLLGDLPDTTAVASESNIYDGVLVDAVKHFQQRHGLQPTGKLDSQTVREMNVPLSDRVEQMRLSLERYRWLRYQFSEPPILVNIPEFRLYGFDEDNRIGLTMNVNVGDAYDFQTPVFENNIRYIVLRPYWNPPPQILRNEIVPDLEDNHDLEENDLELVTAGGRVIKSGRVTAAMLQQIRSGKLQVRQPAGPENALGLVKFIFPNKHHVYIHDTPEEKDMFSKYQRAFSHGCIHAQDPAKLAAWLLRHKPGWDLKRVQDAMQNGRDNVTVNLVPPTPVLIVYATALAKEDGNVHFFQDIYELDASLEKALAKGYPYPQK